VNRWHPTAVKSTARTIWVVTTTPRVTMTEGSELLQLRGAHVQTRHVQQSSMPDPLTLIVIRSASLVFALTICLYNNLL